MEGRKIEATEDCGVFKVHTEHSTILSIFQISLMEKWANSHVCSELSQKTDRGLGRKGRFQGDLAFSGGAERNEEEKATSCRFSSTLDGNNKPREVPRTSRGIVF